MAEGRVPPVDGDRGGDGPAAEDTVRVEDGHPRPRAAGVDHAAEVPRPAVPDPVYAEHVAGGAVKRLPAFVFQVALAEGRNVPDCGPMTNWSGRVLPV